MPVKRRSIYSISAVVVLALLVSFSYAQDSTEVQMQAVKLAENLYTIRDAVSSLMKEGKTMEEVVAAKPTLAFDEKWGVGLFTPDQFAGLVYMDLSPEMP